MESDIEFHAVRLPYFPMSDAHYLLEVYQNQTKISTQNKRQKKRHVSFCGDDSSVRWISLGTVERAGPVPHPTARVRA
jgi:hypothetical protein